MRHGSKSHSFHRRGGPRKALLKGLVISLVENGRIMTTLTKAKELRRHVEGAITVSKSANLNARRILISRFGNENTAAKLLSDIGPRFQSRSGGYTRVIRAGLRAGDKAPMALIEFVDYKLPEVKTDTTVKGDKGAVKKAKALAKERAKRKKSRRQMQVASRRANRK